MKLEEKNGFVYLEGQRVFSIEPDDIIWRMRDGWLTDIENGNNVFLHPILPYFEMEAISRIEKEWSVFKADAPKKKDGYEAWRMWWLNEATQNCETHSPLGKAGNHLSPVGRSAVNILMAASALRHALEYGKAQEAAAVAMVLICEAIAGGYSLKFEAAQAMVEDTERTIITTLASKSKERGSFGGKAKAGKYKPLRDETIRLYELGSWPTISAAAHEILPKVRQFSKEHNLAQLSLTSKKPFEWISEHLKAKN